MHRIATLIFAICICTAATAQNPALHRSPAPSHRLRTPAGNPFLLIDYPGQMAAQSPFSINDSGKIVGFYNLSDTAANGYGLVGKSFRDLSYPGSPLSVPYGINKHNQVVGFYCLTETCDTGHAYTWKAGVFTSFDYPGASNYTSANAINGAGDIVGSYQTPDYVFHGFLEHNGTFTSFDAPGAGYLTQPTGINNAGTIVGFIQDSNDFDHAFILQNGVFTNADYPGSVACELDGINDAGDMVGEFTNDLQTWHGFVLSGGTYTLIDAPFPGTTFTAPYSINNQHQIVGGYGSSVYEFGFLTTY